MFDILVYLFENYVDFADFSDSGALPDAPTDSALTRKLAAAGFAQNEITEALDWLKGLRSEQANCHLVADSRSLRAYTPDESAHLGPQAMGFLHFLEQAGHLSASLREMVLERAMALPDESLSFIRFKVIVLMVLWSQDQPLDTLIIEELLSGSDPDYLH